MINSISRRTLLSVVGSIPLSGAATIKAFASAHAVRYDVPLIPQETPMSCWAAAIAMIVSWSSGFRVSPLQIASDSDHLIEYEGGLARLDSELFGYWGMITEAPQTYTEQGFLDLLSDFGPLWVAAEVSSPHARVVTGFEFGNPTYMGPVYINDPLDQSMGAYRKDNKGSQYTETYVKFVDENERLGSEELKAKALDDDKLYPVYIAHMKRKPSSPRSTKS